MDIYNVRLIGETSLIMHGDNIPWCEVRAAWQSDPKNKKISVKGDDRSPAWAWTGYTYVEDGKIVIPCDNLMTCLMEGGAKVDVGKRNRTFKKVMPACVMVNEIGWPLEPTIDYEALCKEIMEGGDVDFEHQQKVVEKYGFTLFVKRAKVGQSKWVRVRPRFDKWECSGTITVTDSDVVSEKTLKDILDICGREIGLCDWRPGSPQSPGPYGKFKVEMSKQKK